jgi:hypothetical protein
VTPCSAESSAEYMASRTGEEEESSKTKTESEKDTETMADKIKAGAQALKKKAEDPHKNLRTEYEEDKLRE